MALVKLTKEIAVNTDHVESVTWERRSYANSAGTSQLCITMKSGQVFRIEHNPNYLDGTDCYKIEEKLLNTGKPE